MHLIQNLYDYRRKWRFCPPHNLFIYDLAVISCNGGRKPHQDKDHSHTSLLAFKPRSNRYDIHLLFYGLFSDQSEAKGCEEEAFWNPFDLFFLLTDLVNLLSYQLHRISDRNVRVCIGEEFQGQYACKN